ncbi:hypothetical protein BpHYR1_022405 [Brachionus plicatilis]|uniref:Uncharacterized protein n=1 Tax=Brachionus plicatilis TaxID=10195 RepID=A0A3M7R326_BRAPC|nr:hypothetical protein BpHYR1_022405 [Brachionus plicatilis]
MSFFPKIGNLRHQNTEIKVILVGKVTLIELLRKYVILILIASFINLPQPTQVTRFHRHLNKNVQLISSFNSKANVPIQLSICCSYF